MPKQEEPEVRAELCLVSSEYLVLEWYMTAPCLVCDCAALQPQAIIAKWGAPGRTPNKYQMFIRKGCL